MAYQLRIDEIQEALNAAGHPAAHAFEQALCGIADAMAEALSLALDVDCGTSSQEGKAFGGICVPFHPRYKGQPLPDALDGMDSEEEWEADAAADDLPALPDEPCEHRDTGRGVCAHCGTPLPTFDKQ
jgi:hypothetical protein